MRPNTERDGLFTHQPVPTEFSNEPKPTMTPTSDYVLATMPDDLTAVREDRMSYDELRTKHQQVLEGEAQVILVNTDPDVALVTQLDLAFMLGGYLPSGGDAYANAPIALLALLDYQSETFGIPNRMDYELIINVNTREYRQSGVMRTFLDGKDGQHERDFYQGHYMSEPYVRQSAENLHKVMSERMDPEFVRTLLEEAVSNMTTLRKYMGAYSRLPESTFNQTMRPYLGAYPDGTRNASGAFMPSVQLAELVLHRPSDEQVRYIDESMKYFPRQSRGDIENYQTLSQLGFNITDMITSGQLQLDKQSTKTLINFIEEFIQFRMTHIAVVRNKIPQAFDANTGPKSRTEFATFGEPDIMAEGSKGTADFNITNLLAGSIYRLIQLQELLKHST